MGRSILSGYDILLQSSDMGACRSIESCVFMCFDMDENKTT